MVPTCNSYADLKEKFQQRNLFISIKYIEMTIENVNLFQFSFSIFFNYNIIYEQLINISLI